MPCQFTILFVSTSIQHTNQFTFTHHEFIFNKRANTFIRIISVWFIDTHLRIDIAGKYARGIYFTFQILMAIASPTTKRAG